MALTTHRPLSPPLPDHATMQASRESEQDLSVSCLSCFLLAFADNCQIQDSGLGLLANAQNVLVTGSTINNIVVVSLSCGPFKQLIIIYIRAIILHLLIPGTGIRSSLYFQSQTLVHCLLDGKMYSTIFGRFLLTLLTENQ